jgi:alkanesulfonate monooxygenase SsuD/methylene tetrahydromethanopterin reductase-like flavin-dependent oxidoreductase (luciferase family)
VRFGITQSADALPGTVRTSERFKEVIEEAVLMDEMGFDVFGLNEQHFLRNIGVSASEIMFAFVAARTSRIRLRFMSVLLLAFNHPIRVAERLAMLDVLSDGRAEMSTARSNNLDTLEAFGVDPSETRAQWAESLEVIGKALTQDPFEHQGHYWQIPPRMLSPKAVQAPHPPLFASATSIETHRLAGEKGIGVMTGRTLAGWEYVQECSDTYRDALVRAVPVTGFVGACHAVVSPAAHCAETNAQARKEAAEMAFRFVQLNLDLLGQLAPTSPDYAYMAEYAKIEERKRDLDYLIETSPYISIGDPDFMIERLKQLEALGIDEVFFRFDGMGHDKHRKAIELMGRYVLPEFKRDAPRH